MMNNSKKIITLFVVLCSLQISFGQDAELMTMEQNNEIAKAKQSIQIASENLKEISDYVDEVKVSLGSGSLSLEEEQLNMEKLKTLSVLQQAAADILQELISGVDLDKADSLVENAQQVGEIAKQVYVEQVAPTLQAVFELLDNTSGAVAAGQSRGGSGEIPNIYANIGQTPVYQAVMNELHNTFRQSATTPEGGGFGENDATPN
jgi:hypothetical protein